MTADSVSMAALQDEQSELGYVTDRYTDSLDSDISTNGGPYRVEEVGMEGVMPNEGRRYLAALLQRGVKFSKYN